MNTKFKIAFGSVGAVYDAQTFTGRSRYNWLEVTNDLDVDVTISLDEDILKKILFEQYLKMLDQSKKYLFQKLQVLSPFLLIHLKENLQILS